MDRENKVLDRSAEQAQRITEALYRVTDFLKDTEPIKWTLRKESIDIFERVLDLSSKRQNDLVNEAAVVREKIVKSIKFLEVASFNSFVSHTNFSVLKREYLSLIDLLVREQKSSASLVPIELSGFFERPLLPGQLGGREKTEKSRALPSGPGARPSSPGFLRGDRREKILTFIRGRDWVGVGDLLRLFDRKISGKTVQRDLIEMAEEGLLLKEGDKRWRRYKAAITIIDSNS